MMLTVGLYLLNFLEGRCLSVKVFCTIITYAIPFQKLHISPDPAWPHSSELLCDALDGIPWDIMQKLLARR